MKPSDKDIENLREENKRMMTIRVINNGYMLRTRSGNWYYPTIATLFDALRDYLAIIESEVKNNENNH